MTSNNQVKNPATIRAVQILWIAAMIFNFVIIVASMVTSYRNAFVGEVNYDIEVEPVPNSGYTIWSQFTTEILSQEDRLSTVTSVTDAAAQAGLQVGDIVRFSWGQGWQNMSVPITVVSADDTSRTIYLTASDLGEAVVITSVSDEAESAGLRVGDILFGDFIPWFGEVGTEVTFAVLHEGETAPENVTLIRKPFNYEIYTLTNLGLSVTAAAVLNPALTGLVFLAAFGMAIFIFVQRPNDTRALFFAWVLSFIPAVNLDTSYLPPVYAGANWNLYELIVGLTSLFFLLSFPTGRIYPRWSWLLILASLLINLLPSQALGNLNIWNGLIYFVLLLIMAYRYRWHFNQSQRQQSKWFIFGFSLIVISMLLVIPQDILFADNYRVAVYYLIVRRFLQTALHLIAITCVAFAILRYRLYDIDVVINRSLVGIIVTFVLLLIFVPSVFLIQGLLGATNTLASFVISAAIPALIFNPTHKRVRQFVDRRIYGLKFDLNELRAAQKKPEIKNPGALTGKRLGQYEVLDFLGKGGMGEVYKGYHEGQTVALKTLPDNLAKEPEFLRRFQREAEVMQSLEHPKIVKLYRAGESEGLRYLAMEYIEGRELKDILREKHKLSLDDARDILCDLALALDYLHSKGIVHRDMKPSNIMLRREDPIETILMDFGIAKIEDSKTRLTGSGAIGTIDYMAPEQILTAKTVDARADVYALGVIAYEMLTGEQPFKGSVAQILFAHLQQPPPDPRDINDEIPRPIAKAIMQAMAKKPEDRFQSAGEFSAALNA